MKAVIELDESELLSFVKWLGVRHLEKVASVNDSDPIAVLGLSVRTQNCLYDIATVGELCAMPRMKLWRVPNLGRISLSEIENKLLQYGRHLSQGIDGSRIKE